MDANEMNGGRENILRRVRAAMRVEAPKLYEQDGVRPSAPWHPPVGDGFEAMRDRFAEELTALRGEFFLAADDGEAAGKVGDLIARSGLKRIAAQGTGGIRAVLAGTEVAWLGADTAGGRALRDFDLGVTECDALVAQTGSVVLTARSAGGRVMSVLPPNHLVIARREQLVADLAGALRLVKEKYGGRMPSFVSVVTGPSRTSDIEKTLVMGAHGPKRFFVMLVG